MVGGLRGGGGGLNINEREEVKRAYPINEAGVLALRRH